MHSMDIKEVTYTDDDGEQQNAWDYLMADGNLRCFSRYGQWTDDCAYIAIMLFLILVGASGEDTVDALEGCMSQVVNDSDEVCWTILDNTAPLDCLTERVFGGGGATIKLDPAAYFDAEEIEYARELYTAAYCGEQPHF